MIRLRTHVIIGWKALIFKCLCGLFTIWSLSTILQSGSFFKNSRGDHGKLPVKHIAFVKAHKAASSTVLNILYRFASERDLVVLLPKSGNYHRGRYINTSRILPPPGRRTYDILCNHAIFNYTSWRQFLPEDTEYVGIVREPFERFLSSFYYFRYEQGTEYLKRIPGNYASILARYLKKPSRWEPEDPMVSMTNNRMAVDFGYPVEQFGNERYFDEYLVHLNRTFNLVMVTELFDESLVLMRRKFGWSLRDILYISKNKARHKPNRPLISEKLKKNYKSMSRLDDKLYVFFLKRLYRQIEMEGDEFPAEVNNFKHVRLQVTSFCKSPDSKGEIIVEDSKWSAALTFTSLDCFFLTIEEEGFVSYMRRLHNLLLLAEGANTDVLYRVKR